MTGLRVLKLRAWDKPYQQTEAAAGALDASKEPYNVGPDREPSENVAGLKQALADGYDYNRRVIIRGDTENRPIFIDAGLMGEQKSVKPNIGGTGGGGASTRAFSHSIQGVTVDGNKPRIRAVDGASQEAFAIGQTRDEQFPKSLGPGYAMLGFRWNDPTAKTPYRKAFWNDTPGANYAVVIRGLCLETGPNPWLACLYSGGAQGWCVMHNIFDARGGFAGTIDLPGSGAITLENDYFGGDYSVFQSAYRPTPNMTSCRMRGFNKAGIHMVSTRNGLILNGSEIKAGSGAVCIEVPEAIEGQGKTRRQGNSEHFANCNVSLLNSKLSMDDETRPAIDCNDSSIHITDSWIRAAHIARTQGHRGDTPLELNGKAGRWTHVLGWDTVKASTHGNAYVDGEIIEPGTGVALEVNGAPRLAPPPSAAQLTDVWGLRRHHLVSAWDGRDIVRFDDESGNGKRDDPLVDNGPTLQSLIDNQADAEHADFGKPIVIGWGFFFFQTGIVLRKNTVLAGVGQSQTVLMWSSERVFDQPNALITSDESDDAMFFLQELSLNLHAPKAIDKPSGAITRGDLRDHGQASLLHMRGRGRITAVQMLRHEMYRRGTSGSVQAPIATFDGRASGIVHAIACDIGDGRLDTGPDYHGIRFGPLTSDYRLLIVDLNCERLRGRAQVLLDQAHHLVISPFKSEVDVEADFLIRNSVGVLINFSSGNRPTAKLQEKALYTIQGNCAGLRIIGSDRTKGSGDGKLWFEVLE